MRAAILSPGTGVSPEETPEPIPSSEQVLVAPTVVGLCGSDVSYATKGANGSFVVTHPMVLGHEICARLVGPTVVAGVERPPNSLVVVHPLWPSPLAGESGVRAEFARTSGSFLGSASTQPHTNGGLAERLAVRPEQLRLAPAGIPADRLVLAEPLSVVLHAFNRLPVAVSGKRVLVCGAGPIGLLAAVVLRARAASWITITDLHPAPLDLARSLGVDETIDARSARPTAGSFDVAIEATGAPASLAAAVDALAPGGNLLQLGMLPRGQISMELAGVVTKELTITGSHRFAGELDEAIAFLAANPGCGTIVTNRFPLEQAAAAIAAAADAALAGKVIVEI